MAHEDHNPIASAGRELLEGWLERQALHGDFDSPALSASELGAVTAVADRFRGQALSLHPVTVELIRALLAGWFGGEPTALAWNAIADRIAASLYDDPAAHDRLDMLWKRIAAPVSA
jgi:hypothetical protein